MAGPTRDFWNERFASGTIPWDRGAPNSPSRSCANKYAGTKRINKLLDALKYR